MSRSVLFARRLLLALLLTISLISSMACGCSCCGALGGSDDPEVEAARQSHRKDAPKPPPKVEK